MPSANDVPAGENIADVVTEEDNRANPKEVAHVGEIDETESGNTRQELIEEVRKPRGF